MHSLRRLHFTRSFYFFFFLLCVLLPFIYFYWVVSFGLIPYSVSCEQCYVIPRNTIYIYIFISVPLDMHPDVGQLNHKITHAFGFRENSKMAPSIYIFSLLGLPTCHILASMSQFYRSQENGCETTFHHGFSL